MRSSLVRNCSRRAYLYTGETGCAYIVRDTDDVSLDDDGIGGAHPHTGAADITGNSVDVDHFFSYLSENASIMCELGVALSRQLFLRSGGMLVGYSPEKHAAQ